MVKIYLKLDHFGQRLRTNAHHCITGRETDVIGSIRRANKIRN
jgi:hypothetical protein